MNTIIFGGSGFVGSHVADALTEAGHNVVIYDLKKSPYLKPTQKMIVGNVLDEKKVKEAIKNANVVYNLSGIADIYEASKKPIETVKNNILGNTILLEASRKESVKRFIFASSVYVYSDSGSFYRCSKVACENYIETYHKDFGLNYTILRYGTLYGPRADINSSIYRFITQALTEKKITYPGDGNEIREYINVADAAQASVEILSDKYENEHIVLTGHYPMKVNDLLTMIKEILKEDIEIEYIEPVSRDPMHHYRITPYTFIPKVGKKYIKHYHTDLGQGLLLVINEIYESLEKSKKGNRKD